MFLRKRVKSCQYLKVTDKIGNELAKGLQKRGIGFTKITINIDENHISICLNMLEVVSFNERKPWSFIQNV